MQEVSRINSKKYTDADAIAFYMRHRETTNSPFIREIGDFIAHRQRDKGPTFERSLYQYSQIVFMTLASEGKAKELRPIGPCPWWFRIWLLGRCDDVPEKLILRHSRIKTTSLRTRIKDWFKKGEKFPTQINCLDPLLYFNIMALFSRSYSVTPVFKRHLVEKDLRIAFKKDRIETSEIEPFLVATCAIVSGKSCSLPNGFNFTVFLDVEPGNEIKTLAADEAESWPYGHRRDSEGAYFLTNPDGNIKVKVRTNSPEIERVHLIFTIFDSEISTRNYACRNLVTVRPFFVPSVDLSGLLGFSRDSQAMLYRSPE